MGLEPGNCKVWKTRLPYKLKQSKKITFNDTPIFVEKAGGHRGEVFGLDSSNTSKKETVSGKEGSFFCLFVRIKLLFISTVTEFLSLSVPRPDPNPLYTTIFKSLSYFKLYIQDTRQREKSNIGTGAAITTGNLSEIPERLLVQAPIGILPSGSASGNNTIFRSPVGIAHLVCLSPSWCHG